MYKFKLSVTIHHWRLNLKEIGYQRPNAQCILAVVLGGNCGSSIFFNESLSFYINLRKLCQSFYVRGVVMND